MTSNSLKKLVNNVNKSTHKDATSSERVVEIDINKVEANEGQPRKTFDISDLIESIRTHGQLYPALVKRKPGGKYVIVDGERRYRAMKSIGAKKIRCFTLENDGHEAIISLIVNSQRHQINVAEQCVYIVNLVRERGIKQVDLCGELSLPKATVSKMIQIGEFLLGDEGRGAHLKRQLEDGTITGLSTAYEFVLAAKNPGTKIGHENNDDGFSRREINKQRKSAVGEKKQGEKREKGGSKRASAGSPVEVSFPLSYEGEKYLISSIGKNRAGALIITAEASSDN